MDSRSVKSLFNEELGADVRRLFVDAIKEGYSLFERVKDQHLFSWPGGHALHGWLRHIAVEFCIRDAVLGSSLPLECQMRPNAAKNCLHLEVESKNFVITFSQVQRAAALPRNAVYRSRLRESNQLFFLYPPEEQVGRKYALLTHGFGTPKPDFITFGLPEHPFIKGWIDRVDLLNEIVLIQNKVDEEKTEFDASKLIRFREFQKEVQD